VSCKAVLISIDMVEVVEFIKIIGFGKVNLAAIWWKQGRLGALGVGCFCFALLLLSVRRRHFLRKTQMYKWLLYNVQYGSSFNKPLLPHQFSPYCSPTRRI
jgi:hypothetical protein